MGLSSNTLWHQTNYYNLRNIIKEKRLNVSFSLEKLKSTSPYPFNYAFPMISLSDIPFSELNSHLNKYGGHSIGFRRDWVVKNKFTPVCYYSDKSYLISEIVERIEYYRQRGNLSDDEKRDLKIFLYHLANSKNYEGYLKTKDKEYQNYRFSDEREWRFVPLIEQMPDGLDFIIPEQTYVVEKVQFNKRLNMSMPFGIEDIRYIIVEKESQISTFKDLIQKTFEKDFLLTGQIINNINYFTTKQVENDIFGLAHDVQL